MGNDDEALKVLRQGLEEHSDSEDLVIALQKLLRELGRFDEAQTVLQQAMESSPSERIQMQTVQLKREIGDVDLAL